MEHTLNKALFIVFFKKKIRTSYLYIWQSRLSNSSCFQTNPSNYRVGITAQYCSTLERHIAVPHPEEIPDTSPTTQENKPEKHTHTLHQDIVDKDP